MAIVLTIFSWLWLHNYTFHVLEFIFIICYRIFEGLKDVYEIAQCISHVIHGHYFHLSFSSPPFLSHSFTYSCSVNYTHFVLLSVMNLSFCFSYFYFV